MSLVTIDAALAEHKFHLAADIAASLEHPRDYLNAMVRIFEHVKPHLAIYPTSRKEFSMFELSGAKAKMLFQSRKEIHGEKPQPAATLQLEIRLDSSHLAMFAPTLNNALYYKAEHAASNLADAAHEGADLRHPQIAKPLQWTLEIVGAQTIVHYGLEGKSNIVLPDCTVDDFSIEPMQGAIVVVRCKVGCHPDAKQAGALHMLTGTDIEVTITPPQVTQDLAGERPPKTTRKKEEAGAAA